jgi:plastocyanin
MQPIRISLVTVLVLLAFGLVACGSDSGDETSAGAAAETTPTTTTPETGANAPAPSGEAVRSERVEIVDFSYDPDPVTIQAGGKVTWLNRDSASHTATADDGSFDTGTIEEGKLKSESFKQSGTYAYHCTIHPSMKGTIEVVEKTD